MPRHDSENTVAGPVVARLGCALRVALAKGYGARDLRTDVSAGVVVGIVALPLAIALAIATGVPPQYGLYSSIVVGALAAALGGSRVMITGTTAAFVVSLSPVAHQYGVGGLMIVSAMSGLLLIAFGIARLGRLIQFVPHPVTTGFTSGIGFVIAGLQLKDFLGLRTPGTAVQFPDRMVEYAAALPTLQVRELWVGTFTLFTLIVWPRISRRIPAPLVAVSLSALVVWWMSGQVEGFQVATIGSRYGGIASAPPMFDWPWNQPGADGLPIGLSFAFVREMFTTAFSMAALGAMVSLMCAVVADGLAGTRHDSNVELIGQGIANVIGPLFGGFAATGAIARTTTGIRAGARSPVAAITHSLFLLAAVLLLAPLLAWLPMAGLAALLLSVAWNMSNPKHFAYIVRIAPRSDVAVLLTCFLLTVVFDMTIAVSVGVVLAALFFMRRMSDMFHTDVDQSRHSDVLDPTLEGVLVYDIHGPLFFGAAEKAFEALTRVRSKTRAVILRMDDVPVMDVTGLVALESGIRQLRKSGIFVAIAGVQEQPRAMLDKSGIRSNDSWVAVCTSAEEALAQVTARLNHTTRPL